MKTLVLFLSLFVATAQAQPAEGYAAAIKATPLLRTTTTAGDQPIVYPKVDQPEVTAIMVEIPPGAETGWHKHPFPAYAYLLSGELTVELEGGKTNKFKAGDAVAETVNMFHNGRNTGKEPVKLIMFVTGARGEPFTVKAAK